MSEAVSKPDAVELTDWGVIRATGSDAVSFLQGQLTSDVSTLATGEARLAGYCSAKGRLLASFLMWRQAEDVLLACSQDLLASTLKRLSMFVLRARCKLSDASRELRLIGLHGPMPRATNNEATVLVLPAACGEPRSLWVSPVALPAPAHAPLTLGRWRWLEVQSGVAFIVAATADRFVPQMLNYELLGGVDFRKGCFPGQEVVARSQYRGTIKRRTFLFDTNAPCEPGQEVYHSADPSQPAGMVANAAARPDGGSSALVELKLAALQGGSLHLCAADGPLLAQRPLPYEVPV